MENNEERIYFVPGNLVTLKHDLHFKPTMLVTEVVTTKIINNSYWGGAATESKPYFKGIRCMWFSTDHKIQEHVFNTKDLVKIE